MPDPIDPRFEILPAAQREVWSLLAPAAGMGLVLYGGTAIALQLGHRQSIDFDFFGSAPLAKDEILRRIEAVRDAAVLQDDPRTFVVSAVMPSGPVKLSFFGSLRFGRVDVPRRTRDGVLVIASLRDLMGTKLKTILDRAEAKDYRDIAEMVRSGLKLSDGLGAFRAMFGGEPATVLRAIAYFEDGDLSSVPEADRRILRQARDSVDDIPRIALVDAALHVSDGDR